MKRQSIIEILLFALFIAFGAWVRVSPEFPPNFAPVAGLALFAGYFFRSRMVAIAVPLFIMVLSDAFIGAYAWWQMAIVYGMLTLPVAMRGVLRKYFSFSKATPGEFARSLGGLLGCSVAASVLFFIVTNATCLHWYEPTFAGVVTCYVQGLVFFKYTLAGDVTFALLTFGSYAMAMGLAESLQRKSSPIVAPQLITATN